MSQRLADVRLICLDLDDTLWPCMPTIVRAEQAMFDWLATAAPLLTAGHTPLTLREHRLGMAESHPHRAHDLTAMRLIALQELLPRYGYHPALAEGACEVFRHHRNQVEPFDEVVASLQSLRQRFTLVALSNGNAQVEQTPLSGLFHHSFSAEEVGAAKPDPALFQTAMAAAGVGPDEALHVGDDPLRDVQAARALGLSVVWMNRDGQDWPDALGPTPSIVSDLQGLLQLMKAAEQ